MASGSERALWYASPQKLNALSVHGGTLLDRLSSLKLGLLPPSIEVGLRTGDPPERFQRAVKRLEKRLREAQAVVPARDVPATGPVRYFDYQGPTARRVSVGALYVAAVSETTGVLLVGSAVNAIGAPANQPMEFGSESPIDAIKQLFLEHGEPEAVEEIRDAERTITSGSETEDTFPPQTLRTFIDLVHRRIIIETGVEYDSLPHTRGIALYAGAQKTARPDDLADTDPELASVPVVVVGSPIWVEQVAPEERETN